MGFFADGQLKTIAVDSGSLRILGPAGVQGGAWNEDGTILFSAGAGAGLRRVSADGGASVQITRVTLQTNVHRYPEFLPGGRRFLFYANGTEPGIYVGELGRQDSRDGSWTLRRQFTLLGICSSFVKTPCSRSHSI